MDDTCELQQQLKLAKETIAKSLEQMEPILQSQSKLFYYTVSQIKRGPL